MRGAGRIDIVGKTYNIDWHDKLLQLDDCVGKCLPSQCAIFVDTTINSQQMRDALLHEALHGIYSEMGLCEILKDDDEEKVVRLMATGLLQVLRDNPLFTKYILR